MYLSYGERTYHAMGHLSSPVQIYFDATNGEPPEPAQTAIV
jgi:hypothetical protein